MGLYLCNVHGLVSIALLCEHAAAQVSRGVLDRTHATPLMQVCSACMKAHPEFALLKGLDLFDAAMEDPALGPAVDAMWEFRTKAQCGMCVDAARIHGARRRGEPDPFVVYERSLWPIDSKLVNQLRASLLSRFTFPISAMSGRTSESSLSVLAGSFRDPVRVEVYGILDASTQDEITALVKTFFEGLTRNQAKLTFFDAMVVEHRVSKDGKSGLQTHRREQERVLRVEVFG
jgi:hypothetical protein